MICHHCGKEQTEPANAEQVVEITRVNHLVIFFRRRCEHCGMWLSDQLHPNSEPPQLEAA